MATAALVAQLPFRPVHHQVARQQPLEPQLPFRQDHHQVAARQYLVVAQLPFRQLHHQHYLLRAAPAAAALLIRNLVVRWLHHH